MSAIDQLPEKVLIMNTSTKYPVSFLDAAGVSTTADAAVSMSVKNWMNGTKKVNVNQITRASLSRGLTFQENAWEFQFTVTSPTANKLAFLRLKLETPNREMYLSRYAYEFGKDEQIGIKLAAADTADTVAEKFRAAIDVVRPESTLDLIDASVNTATTPDTLTITADALEDAYAPAFRGLILSDFELVDKFGDAHPEVSFASQTEISKGLRGVNYGADIEYREKLETPNSSSHYHPDREDVPFQNTLYTAFAFTYKFNRKAPYIAEYGDTRRFLIYLNEDACESLIDDIADFMLTTPATRATSLEVDGLTVSFSDAVALTNAAGVSSATNLNSAHGKLTPLVGTLAGTDPKYVIANSIAIDDTLEDFVLPGFKTNA